MNTSHAVDPLFFWLAAGLAGSGEETMLTLAPGARERDVADHFRSACLHSRLICISGAHHFLTWEALQDGLAGERFQLTPMAWSPGDGPANAAELDRVLAQGRLPPGREQRICLDIRYPGDPAEWDRSLFSAFVEAHPSLHFLAVQRPGYDLCGPADLTSDGVILLCASDFLFSEEESEQYLQGAGFSVQEIRETYAFTRGDIGLLWFFCRTRTQNPFFTWAGTQSLILETFRDLLQQAFPGPRLGLLCRISVLPWLESSTLEEIFPEGSGAQGIMDTLQSLGVLYPERWGQYRLMPACRQILEEEMRAAYPRPERRQIKREILRSLERQRKNREALGVALGLGDTARAERFLIDCFGDPCHLLEERRLQEIQESLLPGRMERTAVYLLLAILAARFRGDLKGEAELTREMLSRYRDLREGPVHFSVAFLLIAFFSCLESARPEGARQLLSVFEEDLGSAPEPLAVVHGILQEHLRILTGSPRAPGSLEAAHRQLVSSVGPGWWEWYLLLGFAQTPFLCAGSPHQYMLYLENAALAHTRAGNANCGLHFSILRDLLKLELGEKVAPEQIGLCKQSLQESGNALVRAWGHYLVARYHHENASVRPVERAIEEAVFWGGRSGSNAVVARARLLRARVHIPGDPERARGLLEMAAREPFYRDIPLHRGFPAVVQATHRAAEGKPGEAFALLEPVLEQMRRAGYEYGFAQVASSALGLARAHPGTLPAETVRSLEEEAAAVCRKNDLGHLFSGMASPRGPGFLSCAQEERAGYSTPAGEPLFRVTVFGDFLVSRGPERITEEEWPTRKVRGLFCYLLLQRGIRVPRTSLAEMFWPEITDPSQSSANLRVALSLLGKTLRRAGLQEILCRNRQRVWLEVPPGAVVDYFEAEEHYRQGKVCFKERRFPDARRHFLSHLEIVEQPYMQTQTKESWATREKERVRQKLERSLYYLLRIAMEQGDTPKSVFYCRRILEYDPYRQDIYMTLISILKKQGRVGEALAVYKKYNKMIREELKIGPSPEMIRLGRKIGPAEA